MLKVGLTGGIGSGKSTVAKVFEVLGIPVFVSDDAGKWLLQEDPGVRAQVIAAFGEGVYPGGRVDRHALGRLVFRDPERLARLNAIVHPAVRAAFAAWAREQDAPYVVNEAAVLIESGGHTAMDHLVVVTAPEADRIRRVMARDHVDAEHVRARLRNQLSETERTAHADTVIVNDGKAMVIPQVLALHERLLSLA